MLTWNSTKLKTSCRIMHPYYTIFHFHNCVCKGTALLADPGDAIKISGPENGTLMHLNNLITLIKLFSSVGLPVRRGVRNIVSLSFLQVAKQLSLASFSVLTGQWSFHLFVCFW